MSDYEPGFNNQAKTKLIAGIVVIALIAAVIIIVDHAKSRGDAMDTAATNQTSNQTPSSQNTGTTGNTSSTATYKDGTYTVSKDYQVPPGMESIKVTLTVKDGVVSDSSIVNSENDHDSVPFQEGFANGYKSYVVGKSLSAVKVPVISGASDTVPAFNDAVAQIRKQAQA